MFTKDKKPLQDTSPHSSHFIIPNLLAPIGFNADYLGKTLKSKKNISTGSGHKIKIFPTLTNFQFVYLLS